MLQSSVILAGCTDLNAIDTRDAIEDRDCVVGWIGDAQVVLFDPEYRSGQTQPVLQARPP